MASKARASDQPDPTDTEGGDDVTGHMMVDPTMARNMAADRSREIERQVKDQQRAREARTQGQKR